MTPDAESNALFLTSLTCISFHVRFLRTMALNCLSTWAFKLLDQQLIPACFFPPLQTLTLLVNPNPTDQRPPSVLLGKCTGQSKTKTKHFHRFATSSWKSVGLGFLHWPLHSSSCAAVLLSSWTTTFREIITTGESVKCLGSVLQRETNHSITVLCVTLGTLPLSWSAFKISCTNWFLIFEEAFIGQFCCCYCCFV